MQRDLFVSVSEAGKFKVKGLYLIPLHENRQKVRKHKQGRVD